MFRFLRDDNVIKFNKMNILLLTNEVATLKYIKINNIILVLKIFLYKQIRSFFINLNETNELNNYFRNNDVNILYIFMSKVHDLSLQYT